MQEGIDLTGEMKAFARAEVVWQNGDVEDEFIAHIRGTEVVRLDADTHTSILMVEAGVEPGTGQPSLMIDMVPNDPKSYNTRARDMAWQMHLRRMIEAQMARHILVPGREPPPGQQPGVLPFPPLNFSK